MSELRVDNIVSENGSAAPIYSKGMTIGAGQTLTCSGDFTVGGDVTFNSGATVTGVVTFSEVDLNSNLNVTGVVTATSFSGDGSNLSNTGSTLSAGSGTQRVVLTGQTSGTMTSSSTNSSLTFNSSTGALSATSYSGSGSNLTGVLKEDISNLPTLP